MFYLDQNDAFQLEYAFCQTDTPFDDINNGTIAEHGICTVLGLDWLDAKLNDSSFVVSMASVFAKAKQYAGEEDTYTEVFRNYVPNLRLGNTTQYDLTAANCRTMANTLSRGHGAAIHIGNTLSRYAKSPAHMICIARVGGSYHMFDSNFGAYTADNATNCGRWIYAICTQIRPERGAYKDWMKNLSLLPFRP